MKTVIFYISLLALAFSGQAFAEEDPFAEGIDALAVNESDGSMSLRARKKLTKLSPEMIMVRVKSVDDAKFPACSFSAQVLKESKSKDKHLKLLGRGKTYRFVATLKRKDDGAVDLTDDLTQNNLGACYYPARTRLVLKVGGVDLKAKVFTVAELYPKL